ncbi:MAG TPA: hypothetical protein VF192_01590 [Longimicrobiales bacterium]
MHWIRVTRPRYEQSRRYDGQVGEVVGAWGPENSADGRRGYLVEFPDREIVGVTEDEIEAVDEPPDQAAAGEGGRQRPRGQGREAA